MVYLLLKVASSVGMGLVLKQADARRVDRLPLIRINYAVAAVIAFLAAVVAEETHISAGTAALAALTGVLFVAGITLWARTIQAAGLALSVVAMRTAVVVPILASVLIWHERPTTMQLAGAAVALLALALVLSEVAGNRRTGGADGPRPGNAALWLAGLFLVDGLVMVPAIVFQKELPQAETLPFQAVLFVSAFLVTTVVYYATGAHVNRQSLNYGALLGAANLGNYLFLVLALAALPGVVVYPAVAAGEVGLAALAGTLIWHERVGVRSRLGIALAIAALVLIGLGRVA